MTQEDRLIQTDRMRFTKDTLSSNLVLLAIIFNVFYFVSIYQSDVGSYYYTMLTGASIIYNLIFLLTAFLASEGVKGRKKGFTPLLVAIGVGQLIRIGIIPARAHGATVALKGEELAVMGNGQYTWCLICLTVSGICCIAAGITSLIHNRTLSAYMKSLENRKQER